MKNLLVIGSINTDYAVEVDRMPKLGESLIGKNFKTGPGGKGANQAVAIAKIGGNVRFFGAVGNDENGRMLTENLKNNGIRFVGEELPVNTGIALISVCGGDNFIITDAGANGLITPGMIRRHEDMFENTDIVVMQLEIPLESVTEAAKLAKKHGCKVILNTAPACELPEEIYPLIDVLIPNEHEAFILSGINADTPENAENAARELKSRGASDVIITLGAAGSLYSFEDRFYHKSAYKVKAVDSTAAGDTFVGALALRLSEGDTTENAVAYATAASAITVTRRGASESIPSAAEIEKFINAQ